MKKKIKIIIALAIMVFSSASYAWETYKFKVSNINVIRSTTTKCIIGMKELGNKIGSNSNICDNPKEIYIEQCDTPIGEKMFALAMMAKGNNLDIYHQAIQQYSETPCRVKPYNLYLQ